MKLITDPKYTFKKGFIYRIYWSNVVLDNIYLSYCYHFYSNYGTIFDYEKMIDLAHFLAKFSDGKIVELCEGWDQYFLKLKEPFYIKMTRKKFQEDWDLYVS